MTESKYILRNYTPGDFDGYAGLFVEADGDDRAGYPTSPSALRQGLRRPGYSPEHDLFLAETGDEIAGCLNLVPEPGIGRVILTCLVHPRHRRQGVAARLFPPAERRAASLGARVLQGSAREGNAAAEALAAGLGFTVVRRFLELSLEVGGASSVGMGAGAPACRPLQRGEEATLAEIQNRSFEGTWGYEANNLEQIMYQLSLGGFCHEGVIMVCEAGRPAGFCWTVLDVAQGAPPGGSRGRIHMLGVIPDHWGRGLGRRALLAGISHLGSRGAKTVELTVDSGNAEACALYLSAGFRVEATTVWYEKKVL